MFAQRKLMGSSGDHERDHEARLTLMESCSQMIDAAYFAAVEEGIHRPVIILFDLEDVHGGPLVRALEGDAAVDAQIEPWKGGGQLGSRPVFVSPYDHEEGRNLVLPIFPALKPAFSTPPSHEEIVIVVVSMGGASAVYFAPPSFEIAISVK